MGDTKKQKKKYSRPEHPWIKSRIEEERILRKKYGLNRKKEIWKAEYLLKKIKDQVKRFATATAEQDLKEKQLLSKRLASLGLLPETEPLNKALGLSVEDVLKRRLQTLVYEKSISKTIKQARQFIVHGHITVNGKKVTSPGYMVKPSEAASIEVVHSSPLANPDHPERFKEKAVVEKKEVKKKEEEPAPEVVELNGEDIE